MSAVVRVQGLRKSYGPVVAASDVSFSVDAGTFACLIGPNGSGKTTTVECVQGLRARDAGSVEVLGLDPQRHRREVFSSVGVQLQEASLYPRLRVTELCDLVSSLYRRPRDIVAVLESFDLVDRSRTFYKDLSGGEKRKLSVALAFVGSQELVMLDEPTSGLDPASRLHVWDVINDYRRRFGLTVLFTTHDMEEAQRHSDVLHLMRRGRLIATGAPRELLGRAGMETRALVSGLEAPDRRRLVHASDDVNVVEVGETVIAYGTDGAVRAWANLSREGRASATVEVGPARLEDLYLVMSVADPPDHPAQSFPGRVSP